MEKETIIQAIHNYARETGQRLNPKAVLFDMDGVLYDSMRHHARSWMEIAARHHLLAEEKDFYLWDRTLSKVRWRFRCFLSATSNRYR